MKRIAALVAAAAVAFSAAAAAGDRVPPFPRLPGSWSHAEINVTIDGEPHTLILDRGRVVLAGPRNLALREAGGVVVVVPLAQSTIVVVDGTPATIYDLRRRMRAVTMRIDGGAAVRIRARSQSFGR